MICRGNGRQDFSGSNSCGKAMKMTIGLAGTVQQRTQGCKVVYLGALLFTLFLNQFASAQTDGQLTLKPWSTGWWGETNDTPLYQAQSDVKNTPGTTAQVFFWDSVGRFRFNTQDPNAM